jgi:prevent-host-death family protein
MCQMTVTVNIHEAKTHLSRLLSRVMAGEEIIIARAGKPVARLIPIGDRPATRVSGSAKGEVVIATNFDAPLSGEMLEAFEA